MILDALSVKQPSGNSLFSPYRESLKRRVAVRINSVESGLAETDLDFLFSGLHRQLESFSCWQGPDYICLPKMQSFEQLKWSLSTYIHGAHSRTKCKSTCEYLMHFIEVIESADKYFIYTTRLASGLIKNSGHMCLYRNRQKSGKSS
ncbi:unnamed protein product [Protopolystoma xenopodis]|uniref:Uncharacterized protein n=1 Tax=Protopolystoma xenopodis TaxID=117903 RepID=A0A448WP74_9PLAT|nr:unnamed protein product [Protopolystoma xenopodis]